MIGRRRCLPGLGAVIGAVILRVPARTWTFDSAYRAWERGRITAEEWGRIVRWIALTQ